MQRVGCLHKLREELSYLKQYLTQQIWISYKPSGFLNHKNLSLKIDEAVNAP